MKAFFIFSICTKIVQNPRSIVSIYEKQYSKEVAISFTKSLFAAIPYVGQVLNEVAFDYRSRIKQNRLNSFSEIFFDFFSTNTEIDIETLKTEDFSDLFESVLKRVVQTKSGEKHSRFKDILVNQIQNPHHSIDNSETYLDLITSLTEIEIEILKNHQVFNETYDVKYNKIREGQLAIVQKQEDLQKESRLLKSGYANNYTAIEKEIKEIQLCVETIKKEIDQLQKFRTPDYYNITTNDFLYYKQSLYSKGLLIDNGVGALGRRPFDIMGITEFGAKFIQYIVR